MERINYFLNLFKQYDANVKFNIRVIYPQGKGYNKDMYGITRVSPLLYETLQKCNNEGGNVFFKPEAFCFNLADLDNKLKSDIEKLKRHKILKPICILQTSEKCYQAWFYNSKSKTASTQVEYNRTIQQMLMGDPGVIKRSQVMRLPFFINTKPTRNNFKAKLEYFAKTKVETNIKKTQKEVQKSVSSNNLSQPSQPKEDGEEEPSDEMEIEETEDYGYFAGLCNKDPNIKLPNFIRIYKVHSKNKDKLNNIKYIEKLFNAIKQRKFIKRKL